MKGGRMYVAAGKHLCTEKKRPKGRDIAGSRDK